MTSTGIRAVLPARMRIPLLLLWVGWLCAGAAGAAGGSLDQRLLDAVIAGSLPDVRRLLDDGADPDAVLGRERERKVLCMATLPGRARILDLLLNAGADANALYEVSDITSPDPLGCASSFENLEAFDTLVRAGADPDRNLCPSCTAPWDWTMTLYNAVPQRFHIAWYLIQRTTVTEGEIRALKAAVEEFPIPEDDSTLDERALIVDWLRERGLEVDPIEPFRRAER